MKKQPRFEIMPRTAIDQEKSEIVTRLLVFQLEQYETKIIKAWRKWFKQASKSPYWGMVPVKWDKDITGGKGIIQKRAKIQSKLLK